METNHLEKYGSFRQTFSGNGSAKFTDGSQVKTEFIIVQRDDGELLFKLDFTPSKWEILNQHNFLQKVTGTLSDGRSVILNAPLFIKEILPSISDDGNTITIIGYPSKCEFGNKQFESSTIITFEMVNCLFLGDDVEKVFSEDGTLKEAKLSLLMINLGERQVELRRIPEYKQAEL